MAVNKLDPKIIFASEAPAQDTPAVFNNRTLGWGESRKNGGRPTIKQMNALQQDTELKILWLNENAVTPFDATIDYPVNAVTVKDGQFKVFNGTSWNLFLDKSSVGLNNVDNTSDLNKPISTAIQTELDYIDNNGAALPYKDGITYEENAVVVKDGVLQQWKGGAWSVVGKQEVKRCLLDAGITEAELDGEYNYLMQRLAQIAVDKGWDASFVIDGDENQHEINSKTARIAKTIKGLISIQSPKDGQTANVLGYHSATNFALSKPYRGGGKFVFNASLEKSKHNGGTIIDPNRPFPTDWSNQDQVQTWFTSGLTGSGVWVRISSNEAIQVDCFGARGNGVTDDTQAIQATIDYVESLGGGTAEVTDGTYMIKADNPNSTDFNYLHDSGGIALKDNVHLKLSKGAVLKAIPTQERRYNVLRVFNKKNVAISGGRILGERDQHITGGQVGEWGYGIAVTGSEEVSISNIDVEKCYGDGINLQIAYIDSVPINPKGVYIDNVHSLHNRRQGMSIEAGYDVFITRSEFSHTGGTEPASGIDIEPWTTDAIVKNITIDGCRFINNAKKGIIIGGAGNISNIRITNNFLSGNQSGVGAGQITIYTPQEIYKTRDIDVLGNTVIGGGDCDYGILVFDSENVTVKNNTLRNCSLGLSGFVGNSNITYSDNTVTASTIKGAAPFMNVEAGLDDKYKNIKIANNTFNFLGSVIAGATAPSIYIRGHGTEFSGNTIIGAGNVNSMGNNVKFINNSLQDISTLAVSASGANTEVRGNSIHHVGYVSFASGNGIEVKANNCVVANNLFSHDSLNTLPPELIGKKLVSTVQLTPNLAKGSYVIDNIHPSDMGLVNWGYVELDTTVTSATGFSGSTTPQSSSRPIGYRFYNTTIKKELINQQGGWYDLMGGLVT